MCFPVELRLSVRLWNLINLISTYFAHYLACGHYIGVRSEQTTGVGGELCVQAEGYFGFTSRSGYSVSFSVSVSSRRSCLFRK